MKLKITVHGVAYEVDVQVLDAKDEFAGSRPLPQVNRTAAGAAPAPAAAPANAPAAAPAAAAPAPSGGTNSVNSPIAGTVLEVKCKVGEQASPGQVLLVIEAMKMETAISAPSGGKIKAVHVAAGDSVRENAVLVEFE